MIAGRYQINQKAKCLVKLRVKGLKKHHDMNMRKDYIGQVLPVYRTYLCIKILLL